VPGQSAEEQPLSSLEALDEAFLRFRAVRDSADRVIDFEYVYVNRAAEELLGRGREQVLGHRLLELYPSHRAIGLFDVYARVTETGESLRYEFAFDENGLAGEFEIVISRAEEGLVVAGHDITERKRLERELEAVKDELQAALESRVVIEQAKGYLAATTGTDPTTAFLALRDFARNRNLKLDDVCQSVLAGELSDLASRTG
jgi:PAS domain S-box-containing protein